MDEKFQCLASREGTCLAVVEDNWKYHSSFFLGFAHHLKMSSIFCLADDYKSSVMMIAVLSLSALCSLSSFSVPVIIYECHAHFFYLTASLSNAA